MAARRRAVDVAPVGEQAVEHDQRSRRRLDRHEPVWRLRQWGVVEGDEARAVVVGRSGPLEALPQRPAVAARLRPQAPVLERGVLDGEPEADDAERLGVQERGVLVAADLAADVRLLEDVHRLDRQRVSHPDRRGDVGKLGRVAERLEHGVEVVHGVADLVDAQRLVLAECA